MNDSDEPWRSTKALSVYNTLVLQRRAMIPLAEVLMYLREFFDPKYPELWVAEGALALTEWGFANVLPGDLLAITKLDAKGNPHRLMRSSDDSELRYI